MAKKIVQNILLAQMLVQNLDIDEIAELLDYCHKLGFDDTPDYNYCQGVFQRMIERTSSQGFPTIFKNSSVVGKIGQKSASYLEVFMVVFCTKFDPLNDCLSGELHIVLRPRNLKICEDSKFF